MSFEDWQKENAGYSIWQQENAAGFAAWQAEGVQQQPKPMSEYSPREIFKSLRDRSLFRDSSKPIEPGQGSMPQKIEGAVVSGLDRIGKGIAKLPLRISEITERISKTNVPGPSYMPPNFKRGPDKVTKTLKAVQSWYKDFLAGQDVASQEMMDRHPEWQSEPPESFLDLLSNPDKLALAVIESVPLLVAAGLATAAGMPQVGYGLIFAVEGEEAREQALADNQTEEVADQAYLMYGSVATIIEGMQIKGLIKIGKGSYRAVLGKAVGKLAKKKLAPKLIKEAITQAIEEQAQGTWQEATAYLLYGKVPLGGIKGFLDRRASEGLIAATMAGGVSTFSGSAGAVKGQSEKNKAILDRAKAIADAVAVNDQYTDMQKSAMLYTLEQTSKLAMKEEVSDAAPPEDQLDAAETLAATQKELLEESNKQEAEAYDELLEQAQDGDEVAAQKIQELQMGGPLTPEQQTHYEKLLEKVNEGDEQAAQDIQDLTTPEQAAEKSLPTFETLFVAMLEGDEVARSAIENGEYKQAKEVINQLEPEVIEGEEVADRGRTRVDSTIPASEKQTRNFATVKVHALAKLLGMTKNERQQIQNDLIGQKSLKGMNLDEVKKVEAYFIAKVKERGLTVSTGLELANVIKANTTQKQVQEMIGVKGPAWKNIITKPGKLVMQFLQQSRRVERLLEALDGYTEGPIYNSIWKVVQTQAVNSRVSHNARVAKFRDALVDIMTPELGTDQGIEAAAEMIQAEDKAAGRKAKKLGKKAIRKLVGDSLWAKYITGGKSIVLEATDVDPELSLSSSERIGIYLAMKNENSMAHLVKGNLAHFSNPQNALLAVLDSMTKQEQEIGNWILDDLETNFVRANNAAKMGLGRELDQKDNYFPIRVIDVADMKQEDFLSLLEDKPTRTSAKIEPSETKERKHGAQQPLNLDSFEVYLNHLTRIEQFIHMAPVAKSVGGILNTKEFRQALSNTTAGHGPGIMDRWLRNSIRGHAIERTTNIGAKAILWMRQKGVLYSLAGNIPSVVRQFLSGFNAVASHPTILAYATGYMADAANPKTYKLLEQRMLEKSDVIKTRSFERELANVKHQAQTARVLTGKKEFSEIALSWQKWADRRTVTIAWNSFYDAALNSESVQKQFNLDGSDEAAIAFANKMIARTQPMGDVEHLPDFFTGGPIARLLSTFQNQVNNNYNFWAHDIIGMRKAGKISNKMVAYRALFSNILPAMMFGAISRGGLPDDWKDAMFDMVVYNLGPLMIVGRIITDAMLGFAGGQTSVEDILPANFGKMLQATIKAGRAEEGEKRTEQLKKVGLYGTKTVGGLTGRIPNQAIRTGQGIMALATGETDDLRRLIYSDWSLTKYGWPESAEEKARKKEEESWMKR